MTKTTDEQTRTIREQEETIQELNARNAKLEARVQELAGQGGFDLTKITLIAEDAFRSRNWKALQEQSDEHDAFDTGQELTEIRPHWHFARPLESILDGFHKALNGSEWNGRKRKGLVDYRADLVRGLTAKMPDAATIQQYGGNAVTAMENQPEAMALVDAIQHQDTLVAMVSQALSIVNEAYTVASNGEEYKNPQQRAAEYAKRDEVQAQQTAQIDALLAAFKPQA